MSFKGIPRDFNPTLFQGGYLTRKKLLTNISKNISVLTGNMMDFGCGSKPYKNLFRVANYTGVDYNGQGHSHENEQIDVFYDGKKIPFEDNFFDSVFSSEVFEHVFNLEDIIKEINRVMKPNAILLITCPFIIAEHEIPNDFGRYTSFGLKDLLQRNGFEIVKHEKIGTSIEAMMQMFISYSESSVISKLNRVKFLKVIFKPVFIFLMNIFAISLNFLLPKRQDAFLNHIVICKKSAAL